MATKPTSATIDIMEVRRGRIDFCVLGRTPLICNAMSSKVRADLLLPPTPKNKAEKTSTLKHDPIAEFRRSMYTSRDASSPARIMMPATAFKGAMRSAALDLPGSTKAQIGRLAYVLGQEVPIFGIPEIMLSVVRNSDPSHTPDVRSRAILPRWACFISVEYTQPILKDQAIVNLLAAAGITQGVGDWRVQKGAGDYGQFSLVGADEAAFVDLVTNGGAAAQDAAIAQPASYDSETDELLSWFNVTAKRRGFKTAA